MLGTQATGAVPCACRLRQLLFQVKKKKFKAAWLSSIVPTTALLPRIGFAVACIHVSSVGAGSCSARSKSQALLLRKPSLFLSSPCHSSRVRKQKKKTENEASSNVHKEGTYTFKISSCWVLLRRKGCTDKIKQRIRRLLLENSRDIESVSERPSSLGLK